MINNVMAILSLGILAYFLIINLYYFTTFMLSFKELIHYKIRAGFFTGDEILKAKITPPISILAPAYNEGKNIVTNIKSLLDLKYGLYEVILINDGSDDNTMAILKKEFKLVPSRRKYSTQIPTKEILAVYKSSVNEKLLVIEKLNGGKADALNAGINASIYPLFCCIDADSILEKESLLKLVHPFMEAYNSVVAAGGLIRIANDCKFKDRESIEVRTPRKLLVTFQIVEYFRAFLSGRIALGKLNCQLVISGAFGLFKKQPVIDVGGYASDAVGEDMELVVRLHHILRKNKKPCRICFVPDTACWTEAPETLKILSLQRNRWQRGLGESLVKHKEMLCNPRYGAVGMIAMPYFFFIEFLSPVVELCGYIIFITGFLTGTIALLPFITFFLLAVGLGLILSLIAILMEELTFHRYPRLKDLLILMAAAVLENFGYRQYLVFVRAKGICDWMRGKKAWGKMERKGIG